MPLRRGRDKQPDPTPPSSLPNEADAIAFLNPQGTIPIPEAPPEGTSPYDDPTYTYAHHYPPQPEDVTATCSYCGSITRSPVGAMDQPDDKLKEHIRKQYRPFDITFVDIPAFFYPKRKQLDFMYPHGAPLPPVSHTTCDRCGKRVVNARKRLHRKMDKEQDA